MKSGTSVQQTIKAIIRLHQCPCLSNVFVSGSNRGKQPVRKLKSTKINTQSRISTHDAMGLSTKTVSSGNNVLNTSDELRLEKNISHDLPPGCWTADVPLTRHVGQSRTESGETFKAFSGTGFTLGSGTTLRGDRRPTATVTSEDQIKSSDDSVAGKPWMPFSKSKIRNQQPGPYSDTGERNYNNVSDDVLGIVRMPLIGINSRGDFASCQNEDEILKEVSRNWKAQSSSPLDLGNEHLYYEVSIYLILNFMI